MWLAALLFLATTFQAPAPTIQSVTLTANPSPGLRTTGTLFGTNLAGATAVTFSGTGITTTITSTTVSSVAFTVTFDTTAAATDRNVTVTTPGGSATYSFVRVFPTEVLLGTFAYGTINSPSMTSTLRLGRPAKRYRFTLAQAALLSVDIQASSFDPFVYLLSQDGSVIAANDDSGGSFDAQVDTNVPAGTYYIEVTAFAVAARGSFILHLVSDGKPFVEYMSPNSGMLNGSFIATITGTNLGGTTAVTIAGTGVTATIQPGGTSRALPVSVSIAPNTTIGNSRTLTVTTPAGSGSKDLVGVFPRGQVNSMSPSAASPGATFNARIFANDLGGATAVTFSGTGVTGVLLSSDHASVTVNVTVAAGAAPGVRSVTVTAQTGTSAATPVFTVVPASTLPLFWKTRASGNTGLRGAASVLGGRIYETHGAQLGFYDIATDTWTFGGPEAPDGTYLEAPTSTAVNGRYYVLGLANSGTQTPLLEFNPNTKAWTNRAQLTPHRYSGGMTDLNGIIYVAGGYEAGSISTRLQSYDPNSDTWTILAPMPVAVASNHATIGYNGKVYVFGGYTNSGGVSSTVQIYDVASNTWSLGTPMPTARYAAGAGIIDGHIVVHGGTGYFDNWTSLAVTELYDPLSATWRLGPEMPSQSFDRHVGKLYGNNQVFAIVNHAVGTVLVLDNIPYSPPTVTSISPRVGAVGTTVDAVVTGTRLTGATGIMFGGGLTATILPGGTDTTVPVRISIPVNSPLSYYPVSARTPMGTSEPILHQQVSFRVVDGSLTALPTLTGFKAPIVANIFSTWTVTQGLRASISLAGTNLGDPVGLNVSGVGITSFTPFSSSSTLVSAPMDVSAFAPSGSRSVTVTTSAGTSAPLSGLTIAAPTSISSGQMINSTFGVVTNYSSNPLFGLAERYRFTLTQTSDVRIEVRTSTTSFRPTLILISRWNDDASYAFCF